MESVAANGARTASLSIVHVTDVYILDNFPHLATLLKQKRAASPGRRVISMLTGDFLAPSLLSSIDHGKAMMDMIVRTPIDYLTWGNHEADVGHQECCKRVQEYHASGVGTFINSNMQSHELMALQKPYEIIEVQSPDGSQTRKVGLVAVLSNDPSLYKKFKPPGAFGGAKIDCPWETLTKYKQELKEKGCDLVVPLQHFYEFQDAKTCEEFDFPVILSGHDHHRVDKLLHGTRLLKPGADGHYAVVLDITWEGPESTEPNFSWEMVKVADYPAEPEMVAAMQRASKVLFSMRDTELMPVPDKFRPLSSVNSRGSVTTMGTFICTVVKDAFNRDPTHEDCDLCMIRGGHICGEKEYADDSYFSFEDLKTVNTDKISVGIVELPGRILVEGVESSRGSINRLFIQYDDSVDETDGVVDMLGDGEVQPDKLYRVALSTTTARDIPAFAQYLQAESGRMPDDEVFAPLDVVLMSYFARNTYSKVLSALPRSSRGSVDFSDIDTNSDGTVNREDLLHAMRHLGLHTAEGEFCLVDWIVGLADHDGDGTVTVDELREDIEQHEQLKASLLAKQKARHTIRKSVVSHQVFGRRTLWST